ncbi:6-aminohexanoate-dimer hydrolase [Bacillus mycoides]|nr:6-aminohexanoate-dimer hydrolase [Bacillus mycoides]
MNPNQYGYLWWIRKEDRIFSYCAIGDGGNIICCIPKQDFVVVIASEIIPNARDRWELIVKYILLNT